MERVSRATVSSSVSLQEGFNDHNIQEQQCPAGLVAYLWRGELQGELLLPNTIELGSVPSVLKGNICEKYLIETWAHYTLLPIILWKKVDDKVDNIHKLSYTCMLGLCFQNCLLKDIIPSEGPLVLNII